MTTDQSSLVSPENGSSRGLPTHKTEVFDVVVLGGGAGGLAAAVVAACEGLRVLLLEKTAVVGGTSAISGGACWMPLSHHAAKVGAEDSRDAVIEYVRHFTGDRLDEELFGTFLDNAALAVEYFENRTALRFMARPLSPDYRPQLSGASLRGRVLDPLEFDGRSLGNALKLVRRPMPEYTAFNGMMVSRADATTLLNAFSSLSNVRRTCALLGRYAIDRLRYGRGTRLLLGNALVAALLKSALDRGVTVRVEAVPSRLIMASKSRVNGVEYEWDGLRLYATAKIGVVLATGGFPGDSAMKSTRVPFADQHHSVPPPTNDGGGLKLAQAVGALLQEGNVNAFFYSPVSQVTRNDGSNAIYPHLVLDRQKPGIIAVNGKGVRFANEANSYHDFVEAQQRAHRMDGSSIPAFLICDRRALVKYGLGAVHPGGLNIGRYVRSGYLIEAPTIGGLARKLGIDGAALDRTVARTNSFVANGVDLDFGRGNNAYNRFLGDAEQKPNPCLGAIERAPFYAVRIWPGDIGSASGLAVDRDGQVIDRSRHAIEGLYACGNDMNSIFLGTYPGPGITLGPAITFGYIVGRALRKRRDTSQDTRASRVVAG